MLECHSSTKASKTMVVFLTVRGNNQYNLLNVHIYCVMTNCFSQNPAKCQQKTFPAVLVDQDHTGSALYYHTYTKQSELVCSQTVL